MQQTTLWANKINWLFFRFFSSQLIEEKPIFPPSSWIIIPRKIGGVFVKKWLKSRKQRKNCSNWAFYREPIVLAYQQFIACVYQRKLRSQNTTGWHRWSCRAKRVAENCTEGNLASKSVCNFDESMKCEEKMRSLVKRSLLECPRKLVNG